MNYTEKWFFSVCVLEKKMVTADSHSLYHLETPTLLGGLETRIGRRRKMRSYVSIWAMALQSYSQMPKHEHSGCVKVGINFQQ